MKKHLFLFLALVLFSHQMCGANEPTAMDTGWYTFVSLTPTNVILKTNERGYELFISTLDINKYLKANTEFTIPLDNEVTVYSGNHVQRIYTPFQLTNQQKGFRFVRLVDNRRGGYDADMISYIALSESPKEVDESEVVMILEKGEWLKMEDAENLEMTKLKWKAESFINNFHKDTPESIVKLSTSPYFGPLLFELIEKGLITPNEEKLAALKSVGFLPSDGEPDDNTPSTPLVVPEEPTHENKDALPPSPPPARRVWMWWLALPVVAGAWIVFYLKKGRR